MRNLALSIPGATDTCTILKQLKIQATQNFSSLHPSIKRSKDKYNLDLRVYWVCGKFVLSENNGQESTVALFLSLFVLSSSWFILKITIPNPGVIPAEL